MYFFHLKNLVNIFNGYAQHQIVVIWQRVNEFKCLAIGVHYSMFFGQEVPTMNLDSAFKPQTLCQ